MNPNFVGGIEIGTLVAVILLGMVTVQIYVYYLNFPHDSWVIKVLIAIVWMTETAHVGGICYGLYRITVTRYGQLDLPIPLAMCTAAILGNAIHPLVQAIFTARIYQLGHTPQNRFITAICWAISGFILGSTVLLSLKVFNATSIDQFEDDWGWLILALFAATAGVDLLIAATMFYYTLKNRALLKTEKVGRIDTVISWTAQTGLFTCIAAITVAVTVVLYSNSLMSLLNGRLHLGYQVDAPFTISLGTLQQSNRSRGGVQFSFPPTVHLKPPSPVPTTSKPPSTTAASSHAGSIRMLPTLSSSYLRREHQPTEP
ncbi:hypothetical protein C8R46DRAFT_1209264 [Mycena filopes]|nr:hypothetical protein C8R46DRAFT_1209264 [Mycena filopes]